MSNSYCWTGQFLKTGRVEYLEDVLQTPIKRVVKTTGVWRHDDTSQRYVITLWRYVFATHNDQIQAFFFKTLW